MKISFRNALAAGILCLFAAIAFAQKFPERPIHIIVPFPPGGSADILPRLLSEKLSANLGVPIVVENVTGAGGTIGAANVARAKPDGYTLLVVPVGFFFSDLLYRVSYDPSRFAPITILASYPSVLLASPSLPVKNMSELLALAREKKTKLSYASPGAGTNQHLSAEMLKAAANIDMVHIPYRGTGMAVGDLISGTVDVMFDNLITAAPIVRSGKVKLLAIGSSSRNPAFPDTPTISETVPGFESETWMSVVAPPGTPPAIVTRLNAAFVQALADPAARETIRNWQAEPVGNSPTQMAAIVKRDTARWTRVIRSANIQISQ